MSNKTTTVYTVDADYAMGGDIMYPTVEKARSAALEIVANDKSPTTVIEYRIDTQPGKQAVCDIYNRDGFAYEQRDICTLDIDSPQVQQYLRDKENDNNDNSM